MAGNVLALWKPARPLARQNLADAIAAHAAAEQSLIDAKANVGRSMRVADESQAKRDAAVVALSDCKASLASAMAASTSSQATLRARDSALRQARADLDAADDHVEAAQSALGLTQRQAMAASKALDEARAAIKNAACAVIADEALHAAMTRARAFRAELDAQTLRLTTAINVELACLKFLSEHRETVTHHRTIEPVGHPSFRTTVVEYPRSDEFSEASAILDNERKIFDGAIQAPVRTAWGGPVSRPFRRTRTRRFLFPELQACDDLPFAWKSHGLLESRPDAAVAGGRLTPRRRPR